MGLEVSCIKYPTKYSDSFMMVHTGVALSPPRLKGWVQAAGYTNFKSVRRPKQSFEIAALDDACLDEQHALFSIQRLPYVIR